MATTDNGKVRKELERMLAAAEDKLLREHEQQKQAEAESRRWRATAYELLWQAARAVGELEPELVKAQVGGEFRFRLAVREPGAPMEREECAAWEVEIADGSVDIAVFQRLPADEGNDFSNVGNEQFAGAAEAREYLLNVAVHEIARQRLRRAGQLPRSDDHSF